MKEFMSGSKKYGSFAGVFTPSLLTILGVIMYMRLGWIVGNAGLWGSLIIIFIAHIISFTTGLSISSIATDKKVGAGGVYYVLSRSLGMPIGGAIGLTLFVGTSFSIALYLIGFSESFNSYLGFDTSLDGYRITAGITLLVLTIIAFVSTSIALKIQFFILLAIILSLVSIFFGDKSFSPETISSFGDNSSVPFETVFAIFFPAVTGFTAGIAMSGDLKDPKKAIPKGTMFSIIVGFIVYVFLALFIAYTINPELLKSDNTILIKIAWFSPLVVAGIWGATLSSALGGILGGPRILQAMSLDKITPKLFAKGTGKNKEPRLALVFTVILAGSGILIGELNMIARIVSMFYLAAYGFINLSFFLESWASSDFRPTFKVNKWIGFVGFVVTFIIMFKLDMFAMFMAFIIIGGIYFWLSKKEFSVGEGDVWQSVWTNIIKKGLKTLNSKEEHKRNWKPNILLFSGRSNSRQYLLEFSKFLTGKTGIVTNFDLKVNKEPGELFSKDMQSYHDDMLEKYGVFGRQLEVNNLYLGIETIASVFGFSGIDPNTILMGWARNSKDSVNFAKMTNKLMKLDYNVLYLDYDKDKGFGNYQTIDLWWRGISRNAELTLMLVKSLLLSNEWRRAEIRIILVNNTGEEQQLIKKRIEHLILSFRVVAKVFIINNYSENKSIYDLMKIHSGKTDLILLGIPEVLKGEEEKFVENVNNLVDILGTTLLVKASSEFDIADLGIDEKDLINKVSNYDQYLPVLRKPDFEDEHIGIQELEKELSEVSSTFDSEVINPVINRYLEIVFKLKDALFEIFDEKIKTNNIIQFIDEIDGLPDKFSQIINEMGKKDTYLLFELMKTGLDNYISRRNKIISNQDKYLRVYFDENELHQSYNDSFEVKQLKKYLLNKKNKDQYFDVKWKKTIEKSELKIAYKEIYSLLLYFLDSQFVIINKFARDINNAIISFVEKNKNNKIGEHIESFEKSLRELFDRFEKELMELSNKSIVQLNYVNRIVVNEISTNLTKGKKLAFVKNGVRKEFKHRLQEIERFPDLWYQLITPFLSEINISFLLNSLYLDIIKETDKIKKEIKDNLFISIERLFSDIDILLDKLSYNPESNSDFNMIFKDFNIEEIKIDTERILAKLFSEIENKVKSFPEDIDVLEKEAYNHLVKKEIDKIESISLPLDKIVNYIVSAKLLLPLKEKLSVFDENLVDIKLKLNSVINMLTFISGSYAKEDINETKLLIQKVLQDFKQLKEEYFNKSTEFFEYWIQILHQLNLNLDIDNLKENIEEFNKFIKNQNNSKLGIYIKNVYHSIKFSTDDIQKFISNTREDIRRQEYRSEYETYLPPVVGLKKLISYYLPDKIVLKKIPYYYLQLFKGSRYTIPEKNGARDPELNEIKNYLKNLIEPGGGLVLVSGVSGIGKSWFLERLGDELSVNGYVFLDIHDYINKSKYPLRNLISEISGSKGSVYSMMSKFPIGTVFIIDDIENYISVKEGDKCLLDELAELVDRFRSRYYFIASANINSIKLIEKMSDLLNNLSMMKVLDPLPEKYIEKTILSRHFLGNLTLFSSKGKELSKRNMHEIILTINKRAKGNPGMAMTLWLSMLQYKDNRFYIDKNIRLEDIHIENKFWISLLQRILIFGNISLKEFIGDQYEYIKSNIKLLEKTGIIKEIEKDIYRIDKFIKPFIEQWLKKMEIF